MLAVGKFLRNIAKNTLFFLLGAGVMAQSNLNISTIQSKPKIAADFYIGKIEGDKLSDSFYSGSTTNDQYLVDGILKKLGNFYSRYGFDTEFSIKRGEVEDTHREDTPNLKKRIIIHYTSLNRLKEFFLKNPNTYFREMEGEQWLREYYNSNNEKIIPFIRILGERGVIEALENKLRGKIMEEFSEFEKNKTEGSGLKESSRVYIYPMDIDIPVKSNNEYVNFNAFKLAHEIGHALGLEHILVESGRNLMSLTSCFDHNGKNPMEKIRPLFEFDVNLYDYQVKIMKENLKSSNMAEPLIKIIK